MPLQRVVAQDPARTRPPAAASGATTPSVGDSRRLLFLLIATTWGLAVVPRLVQTLTTSKFRMSVGQEGPSLTSLAAASELVLLAAAAVVCLWILATRLPTAPADRWGPLAVALSLWGYVVFRDLYAGYVPNRAAVLYPLLVLAVWSLRPALRGLAPLGWLTGAAAAISTAVALAAPDRGLFRNASGELIQPDKQLLPGGVLVGVFTQGNILGQFLVLGLPAVVLVTRRRWRALLVLLVLLVAVALVWTASRSSLAALAAASAVYAALALAGRAPALRAVVSAGALAVAAAVAVLPPLLTHQDTAFTNRGYIWRLSLGAWSRHPVVGLGTNYYDDVAKTANPLVSTAFHAHNGLLQVLVTGGVVQLALITVLMALFFRRAVDHARAGSAWPTMLLASLLVSSVLEVPFGVVDRDYLLPVTVLPLAVLLFADVQPRRRRGAA